MFSKRILIVYWILFMVFSTYRIVEIAYSIYASLSYAVWDFPIRIGEILIYLSVGAFLTIISEYVQNVKDKYN